MTDLKLRFEEIINLNYLINNSVNAIDDFGIQMAAQESNLSVQRGAKLIESRQIQEADAFYEHDPKTNEVVYKTAMINGKLEQTEPKVTKIDDYNEWYVKFLDHTATVSVMQITFKSNEEALNAIDPLTDYKEERDRLNAIAKRRHILRGLFGKIILIKPETEKKPKSDNSIN